MVIFSPITEKKCNKDVPPLESKLLQHCVAISAIAQLLYNKHYSSQANQENLLLLKIDWNDRHSATADCCFQHEPSHVHSTL